MTAIEQVQPNDGLLPSEQRQLMLVQRQATRLANSELVPPSYRYNEKSNPKAVENVIAVALYGRTLGLDVMTAVQSIHIIQGRFVPSSQVTAGVVMRAGHEIRIPEQTAERCVVDIRRRGTTDWQRVTCTIKDAETAGLAGKGNWASYPADMLGHFTLRRACKRICPDALLGLDLGGDDGVSMAPYSADAVTAGELVAGNVIEVDVSDFDPDADNDLGDGALAAVVADDGEEPGAGTPQPTPGPRPTEQPTGLPEALNKALHAELNQHGLRGPLKYKAASLFVEREVTSTSELTRDEASRWIDALKAERGAA